MTLKEWTEVIHDWNGHEYHLYIEEEETSLDARLYDGRIFAGEIKCLLYLPDALELCEIIVHNRTLRRQHWIKDLLCGIRHQPLPTINYRGRGLGVALLEFVMASSQRLGIKAIIGFIKPHEGSTFEFLAQWYQAHGFEVRGNKILMRIEPGER